MSDKLPVISGKELLALLEKFGFNIIRVKGSHHRMKHIDGRITTIPVHKNDPIPKFHISAGSILVVLPAFTSSSLIFILSVNSRL